MRVFRLKTAALALTTSLVVLLGGAFLATEIAPAVHAQSLLAGDVTGTVVDQGGAAVANATVKVASKETGQVATATTSAAGAYRFSLLEPGTYTLTVSGAGFKEATTTVTVATGQIATQNIQLTVGATSETVEVSATAQLLQTDSADLSTQFDLQQLQSVPNPGGDITFVAQTAPGAVMDTGGEYGNFEVFGLPGTSNNFTMNGMQVNDPFLNLNNSGPSNLLLGLNDVQEVSVTTNAYGVQFGSFGGAQVSAISRSGSNAFHGNLSYWWNGRSLNANNWFFNDSTPATPRPFSNSNQWAAAVGGPIIKDKAFFFANYEGLSFITSSQNALFLPSASYEAGIVGSNGNCSDATSSLFTAGYSSECPLYKQIFSLYNGTPNYASATSTGTPGELQLQAPAKVSLSEKLFNARYDEVFSDKDKAFIHFKYDHGVQPTYNDPINTAFTAISDQPDYEGQLAETHSFGAKAVNQFLVTGSWYSALFVNQDPAKELAALPFELQWADGLFSTLNNNGLAWPEGRNVTQYQFGDDFSYIMGRHTLKAGFAFKKDDVSDHDTGILATPLLQTEDLFAGSFSSGQAFVGVQNTPSSFNLPISLYTLGFYFQDDWKPLDNLTVTAGIRIERNSNPHCPKNCLSNFGGDFFSLAAGAPLNSTSGAYNQQIKSGLSSTFTNYLPAMAEPRVGFTWSPTSGSKTVVRGGFGIFTDVFPATIADSMLSNPPLTTSFTIVGGPYLSSLIGQPLPPLPLQPSNPASPVSLIAGANATFQSGFKSGGSFTSMSTANPNYAAPNFTTVAAHLQYPTYDEWSLQIQHEFSQSDSIQVGYVGNHGYHEPIENQGVNASAAGGAFGLPATSPAPSFATVNEIDSTGSSNYNGVIVSYVHHGHGLSTQLNYAWSHNLDEISNGGILPFGQGVIGYQINPHNLAGQYGNSDYDVRHYFSGNYLYGLHYFGGPRVLTEGWQASGTIFSRVGFPFTPQAAISSFGVNNFDQGSGNTPIAPAAGTPHHCSSSAARTACLSAADFPSYTGGNASPFGAAERNQFTGPGYFDTDLTIIKSFKMPHMGEATKLNLGATGYNLLNHPNFQNPNPVINNGSSVFGHSLSAAFPPTSIYGAFLGGDASVRIIQMTAKFVF
jgi:hypothetical protein